METRCRGTFVISWSQTQTDGEIAAPPAALAASKTWRWDGEVVRIDGPGAILRLDGANGEAELRGRVADRVRRVVRAARPTAEPSTPRSDDGYSLRGGLPENTFIVTDGRKAFSVSCISAPGARDLALFMDDIPPRGCDLWIVEAHVVRGEDVRWAQAYREVICFTPGTAILCESGPRDVTELAPGDLVQTKDNGLQPLIWTGSRQISGARLYLRPDLRPVRVCQSALGQGQPDAELLVSPSHRLLLGGSRARDLFASEEVLVRARDLVDGRRIWIDPTVRAVTYIHLLLERHEVLFANGLETESFSPQGADLTDEQAREIAAISPRQGPLARRVLSSGEAAILGHAA